ncbi:glycosyl transferase family 1 [Paenibacillus sp. CAA11]|uniref:glycosyltransferase family 4 protein n=1 Tax=Paenibacillus sp. CAA11 TaxID=1532905 RepID=UPI000D391095|nr:glycosyltransferase family 4 protein [Paenibacillus sp. CAA11]AWB46224.1 glycosyl transferase family 1 [Paenibacillus sp. CAA11]
MLLNLRQREFTKRYNRLVQARPQQLAQSPRLKPTLKVVYVLSHVSVGGGVKIILEQANRLINRGWEVVLVSHYPRPNWFPTKADYIKVPFGIEVAQGIPDCDVIVATYWDHIQACIETGIAPVVYFEQGDEHLFHPERFQHDMKFFVSSQLKLPQFIMTVSNQAGILLKENFEVDSAVVPNAIDHEVFFEKDDFPEYSGEPYILMIGNENTLFKGIRRIIKAVNTVKLQFPEIKLYWISPISPSEPWASAADRVFVNPPQKEIAELYRGAVLFVSASEYESFSLPVLEAMASGCPVVSTKNTGVLEYGIDNINVVFVEIGNDNDLINKIKLVLKDEGLREKLSSNGLKTAANYSWNKSIDELMEYLSRAAQFSVEPYTSLSEWDIKIKPDMFSQTADWDKFLQKLTVVPDDLVYLPVVYDWIDQHSIARWEVAAIRKTQISENYIYINLPVRGNDLDPESAILGKGIYKVKNEQYNEALDYFVSEYSNLNEEWKPICSKWIILCLIELERDKDALNVILDTLKVYEHFSDVYYLYYLLLQLNNSNGEAGKIADTIRLIGDSMSQSEWFFNVEEQLSK